MRLFEAHEDELIRLALEKLGEAAEGFLAGPREEDAAVFEVGGERFVLTCDTLFEGVHFRREWCPPPDLARKALWVNLSDVAAMAGEPICALFSLALPKELSMGWLEAFYEGLREAAEDFGVRVAGGDIVRSPGPVAVSGFLLGRCKRPILRSGASPGDVLAVTGFLGASRAGLEVLERFCKFHEARLSGDEERAEREAVRRLSLGEVEELVEAHLRPKPRIREAKVLSACGARAMMDLSDGLALDARRMARASKVKLTIELERIPLHPAARIFAKLEGLSPLVFAAEGGEDYELLVSLPPERFKEAKGRLKELGCPLTEVGKVEEGEGAHFIGPDGREVFLRSPFEHFGAKGSEGFPQGIGGAKGEGRKRATPPST